LILDIIHKCLILNGLRRIKSGLSQVSWVKLYVGAALGAWIAGRAGRKLKVGDVGLEANSPADIDHLLAKAVKLKTQLSKSDKSP
jgi:hypothetical protein